MIKKITYIIYTIIIFFDKALNKLSKKHFRYYLYDYLRRSSYEKINVNGEMLKLFTPSQIAKSRANRFFTKEPGTLKWIDSFSRFGNLDNFIFWDIGANVGLFSIYASTKHKNLKVFSFERSTSNLVILSRNISINKLSEKVIINQLALTDKDNQFLSLKEGHFEEGGALNTFGEEYNYEGRNFDEQNKYKIYGTSINYLIEKKILDIPNFIKIDVDGIEHLILKGANRYLQEEKIKSIQVELNEGFEEQYISADKILKDAKFILKSKVLASSSGTKSKRFSQMLNCIYERE